ncbi:hypothetical protein D3C87_1538880 [compost metagenome]
MRGLHLDPLALAVSHVDTSVVEAVVEVITLVERSCRDQFRILNVHLYLQHGSLNQQVDHTVNVNDFVINHVRGQTHQRRLTRHVMDDLQATV